ncbi:MAG: putative signal transducing protein [Thermomicrobiales bacterium]
MPFRFKKPTAEQHPEGKIVPIATVDNQMVADMAIGILKMHHIPCMARAGGLGMVWLGPALQPHDILVLEDDRPRAEEILKAFSDDEDVKLLWR